MTDWSSGLCACFENVGICIKTYFCPCIVAGKIGEALGENCCYHGFCSLMGPIGIYCGAQNRGKLRDKFQIPGTFVNDCLMHWCCPFCAYAQEARELQSRMPAGSSMARS
ncbi:cell number regulator 7-like [Orbicella faveolata]|uniref:cell number regulator 7-like n=1 Tax=Orbicella faveolata TaxID=48498 RepID=UPI0009E471C0|nr:cell number regulator 7-like [Orbicella faveolata]